jgi:uncharacterized membrane protein
MNKLLVAGLIIIALGVGLILLGSVSQPGVSIGGFILIGPIPIVFGSGVNGGQLATLALALGLLFVVLVLAMAWSYRSRALRS